MSFRPKFFHFIVLSVTVAITLEACANSSSYPTPDEFISRWNARPARNDIDDQAVMQIARWSECSPGSQSQCLMTEICAGHGKIIATKAANGSDYNYGIIVNQGYAFAPSGKVQCPTSLNRAVNVLYGSAEATQQATVSLVKQPEVRKVVNGVYSDVKRLESPNGFLASYTPSMKGDATVQEFLQFMYSHDNTILITKTSMGR